MRWRETDKGRWDRRWAHPFGCVEPPITRQGRTCFRPKVILPEGENDTDTMDGRRGLHSFEFRLEFRDLRQPDGARYASLKPTLHQIWSDYSGGAVRSSAAHQGTPCSARATKYRVAGRLRAGFHLGFCLRRPTNASSDGYDDCLLPTPGVLTWSKHNAAYGYGWKADCNHHAESIVHYWRA